LKSAVASSHCISISGKVTGTVAYSLPFRVALLEPLWESRNRKRG
jgi:hypothetical protein